MQNSFYIASYHCTVRPSLFLTAVALLSAATPSGKEVDFYTPEKEIALGQALAAKLQAALPLIKDQQLAEYLATLGAGLNQHILANPFPFSFKIYDDTKPNSKPPAGSMMFPYQAADRRDLEPVAIAGGPIFVPLGLLRNVRNEPDLAAVLAHAMAHIALRHSVRMAALELGIVSAPVGLLEQARKYELDADALAVRILADSGSDPGALAAFLSKPPPDERSLRQIMLSSLPPRPSRIEAIRNVIAGLPRKEYAANPFGKPGEFAAISAKIKASR
jgi:predicted Zn-dependent protease